MIAGSWVGGMCGADNRIGLQCKQMAVSWFASHHDGMIGAGTLVLAQVLVRRPYLSKDLSKEARDGDCEDT